MVDWVTLYLPFFNFSVTDQYSYKLTLAWPEFNIELTSWPNENKQAYKMEASLALEASS